MADEKKPAAEAKTQPEWKGSISAAKPLVAPDGHETLTADDIAARDGA